MLLQLVGLSFLLLIIWWYISKRKNLPPGPNGFPLIGCLPQLILNRKRRSAYFAELCSQYKSDVICLRVGFAYILVLNSHDAIKEGLVHHGDAFSGRGLPVVRELMTNGKGLVSSEGQYQRDHRRFLFRILRDFGFGKVSFEDHVITEIDKLCEQIDELTLTEKSGAPIEIHDILGEAVANNITAIVFGKHLDKPDIRFLTNQLRQFTTIPTGIIFLNAVPQLSFLVNIPGFRSALGVNTMKKIREPLQQFVYGLVKEHKETFNPDDLSDVLYTYIAEQEKHAGQDDEYWWDDEMLMHACTDLLLAGTETTKSTVGWGLNLMCIHPDIQTKLQEELDAVIGRDRRVSVRDQSKLPFTEATVLELLRYSTLAPTSIPHAVTQPTKLYDYDIPTGTFVLPNLLNTTRDPEVWPAPTHFDPTANFLNGVGDTVVNREKIIPFSIGRRSCIGESLARMEVFLFLANLLHSYQVLSPGDDQLKMVHTTGLFRTHKNYHFRFVRRN